MTDILNQIIRNAKKTPKRIVLPEGADERVLKAAKRVYDEKIAIPIILGNKKEVNTLGSKHDISLSGIDIIDPNNSNKHEDYIKILLKKRKHRGMTEDVAKDLVKDPSYYGTLMVESGDADGLVSGATHSTADTLRPALQIIKTKEGIKTASSFFLMDFEDRCYIFGDCGFVIDPDADQLAEIAISTAESARMFNIDPKIALLSFSTKGSASSDSTQKVIEATKKIKKMRPDLHVDGELQLDSAIVPRVAQKKCPDSDVAGNANVLIFPNLDAGNIGYKLTQYLGGAKAIGPLVQGLKKPVNDLSRGCNVEDIVDVIAFTVVEAQ